MKAAFVLICVVSFIAQLHLISAGGASYQPSSSPLPSPSPSIESPSSSSPASVNPSISSPPASPYPSSSRLPLQQDIICTYNTDGMILNGYKGGYGLRVCHGDNFTVDGFSCSADTFFFSDGEQCCCFPQSGKADVYFPTLS